MTAEVDTTRVVRAWLEEGVTRLPDRVLDAVLADVPSTPQRRHAGFFDRSGFRRSTQVRLLVALMALAIVGASLAVATGTWRLAPIARPFDTGPLDAGRYVIDRPFPVRISLDLPVGWMGNDLGNDTAAIVRSDTGEGGPALTFTEVDGVYPDPCHWADGSIVPIGPGEDLAAALARTGGVTATVPVATDLGGYPAKHLAMTGPPDFTGCTSIDDAFHVWGLPQTHSLLPGEHDEIWIAQVGSTRLVAYSEVYPTTPASVIEGLDAIVASVRLEQFAQVPEPTVAPSEEPIGSWPLIVEGGPLEHAGYEQPVELYTYGLDGTVQRASSGYVAALLGESGWIGHQGGIASDPGSSPNARVAWSSIATVYLDPCHWQTSTLGTAAPPLMRDRDGLTAALSAWWPTTTDSKVSAAYAPPSFAPVVAPPKAVAWNSLLVQELGLTIPNDLDLASCDDGEYRLWETHEGAPRTAQPGERLQLDVSDFQPGLIVREMGWQRSASTAVLEQMRDAWDSLWIGQKPGTQSPSAS
ncbi:MAG TPA: hypothetical protein VFN41_14655 [Candidatus Limnocylindrales bacterium]|nr:hypothetical protein [Candidatus Limnocylindrales bacterium]